MKKIKAEKKVLLNADIVKIWDTITDNTDYAWRSDLTEIRVENELEFTEVDKSGIETEFEIIKKEPYQSYEFKLHNQNMKGRWRGVLEEKKDGTELSLNEELEVGSWFLGLFAGGYVKRQQNRYIKDLRKKIKQN